MSAKLLARRTTSPRDLVNAGPYARRHHSVRIAAAHAPDRRGRGDSAVPALAALWEIAPSARPQRRLPLRQIVPGHPAARAACPHSAGERTVHTMLSWNLMFG